MIDLQEKGFIRDNKISDDEYEVIKSFLNQYRGKKIIVADYHQMSYNIVPFENEKAVFKSNDTAGKFIDFKRRIVYKRKPYIVTLYLWNFDSKTDKPNRLTMKELTISTPGKVHSLTFTTDNNLQKNLLYNIIEIFNEKKIISPEEVYSKNIYINKQLQVYIKNHEWGKIIEGINQKPDLANALFIIGNQNNHSKYHCKIDENFGTILYQLITYRKDHEKELTKRDLLELDKAILNLSKTELLKVSLFDYIEVSKYITNESILLGWKYFSTQTHVSEQCNVSNGELIEEKKSLKKVLQQFK